MPIFIFLFHLVALLFLLKSFKIHALQENIVGEDKFAEFAIATEVPECSCMAKNVIKTFGGNAVDAAIAATLCIGSINSFSSGIGGGGFMIIRLNNGTKISYDFREKAPNNLDKTKIDSETAKYSGLSVAVPGELRGLEAAHKDFGSLPWESIVMLVVKLNRDGFKVSETMRKRLEVSKEWILKSKTWSNIFAPTGDILNVGDTIVRKNYAETLEKIAKNGVSEFYKGEIAKNLVATIQRFNGVITEKDLETYQVRKRELIKQEFRGHKFYTSPLPSCGPALLHMLGILDQFNSENLDNATIAHRLVEIMRFGFAFRTELGDLTEKIEKTLLELKLSALEYKRIAKKISDDKTLDPSEYGGLFEEPKSSGTTHLSIFSKDGISVSLTTTINLVFGSRIMDQKTGIILNNEIDDFSFDGFSNEFKLPPSKANEATPGKRPLSSSVPVFVEDLDNNLVMVLGASGGSRILSSVFWTLSKYFFEHQNLSAAVKNPRLHDQLEPNQVEAEIGYDKTIIDKLNSMGHFVEPLEGEKSVHHGTVQAIALENDGKLLAVADPRKGGGVCGV